MCFCHFDEGDNEAKSHLLDNLGDAFLIKDYEL